MASSDRGGIDRRSFLRVAGGTGVVGSSTLLAGCAGGGDGTPTETGMDGDGGTDTPTQTTAEPSEVEMGGTLTVAMQSDVSQTLNPHKVPDTTATTIVENVGNSLVQVTPGGEIIPDLAKDWEISDDSLTYTFTLHEGVQWHEPYASEVTADDIVWNWRKILSADYGAYGRSTYSGFLTGSTDDSDIDPEETVKATGDYEVTFELAQPYAPFLIKQASMAAFGWFIMVPPEAVKEHGENFGARDVGVWSSGPFTYNVEESKTGSKYVLDANPDYFRETEAGQLPYLDRIVFTVAPESSTRVTGLKAGEVDVNESTPPNNIESVKNAGGANVYSVASSAKTSQWVNRRNFEPLTKKQVRKALMYAANREAIIQTKFAGHGAIAHSPLPPWSWAYDKDACVVYDHDPEQAQSLLQEAGHGDGFSFKCEPTNQPKFVDVAIMLQQQYSQVGVDMEVEPAAKGTVWSPLLGGWGDESVPPESWQSMVENYTWGVSADDYTFSTFHTGVPFNYTYYSNEEADAAMEKGRSTLDRDARKEAYRTAQQHITDDMPKLFMLWNNFTPGYRDRVHNFRPWPTAYMSFEEVWVEQG